MLDDMNRCKIFAFTGLLVLLLSVTSVMGTTVRLLNLVEMVQLADRVFWGKCLSVEEKSGDATSVPVLEYVFAVQGGIKGVQTGETVVFRQLGTGPQGALDIPHYQKGQEILLFLHGDSRLGLTSPVGLAQGVFQLKRTAEGEIGVLNALENTNLKYMLSGAVAQESGMSAAELNSVGTKGPIPIEIFSLLVEKIDRYQASKGKSLQ